MCTHRLTSAVAAAVASAGRAWPPPALSGAEDGARPYPITVANSFRLSIARSSNRLRVVRKGCRRWSPLPSDGDRSLRYSQGRTLAVVHVLSTLSSCHASLSIAVALDDMLISVVSQTCHMNGDTCSGAGFRSHSRLNSV